MTNPLMNNLVALSWLLNHRSFISDTDLEFQNCIRALESTELRMEK